MWLVFTKKRFGSSRPIYGRTSTHLEGEWDVLTRPDCSVQLFLASFASASAHQFGTLN